MFVTREKTTIAKDFHFYAAHRNVPIGGKCANLHGHTYRVTLGVVPNPKGKGGVTTPFDVLDRFGDFLAEFLDHGVLVGSDDAALLDATSRLGGKRFIIPGETSVENVAMVLAAEARGILVRFGHVREIAWIEVRETASSTVRIDMMEVDE